MVIYMKTTVQIPDSLFEEARKLARDEKTTMKSLIEEGLRRIIAQRRQRGRFSLKKRSFKGRGLQTNMEGASWERIRHMSYEGHGG